VILKTCSKCKEQKPHSEFGKNKSTKDGLCYCCKKCRNQSYKENIEKERQRQKRYYKENAEKIRQRSKRYYKNLPAAVYKIENTKTGQVYIGQSTGYKSRWNGHKSKLHRNKHKNPKLQEDYDKYGLDVFEFKIIKEFPSDTASDILLKEEIKMIAEYNQRGENLYNIREESEE
jgi:hypothetical protein